MRIASLSLIAALAAGPALADDEPMSTAGATQAAPPAASSDTAAQIEQWIADSPAAPPEPEARLAAEARKIHGEVGVSVGTGGYRSGYVVTHIPIGETGSATIALSKTDYGDRLRPVFIGRPDLGVPFN
jgi:hypothetical protein